MTPGLPLAPSVQCCLDGEHLRGTLPGAETGVRPRGAAVNIDPGGGQRGGGCTAMHTAHGHSSAWGLVSDTTASHTRGCRTFNSQSTHSQLTVNSTVNSQSTQQSTQRSTGQPNPGFTLRNCWQGVVIRPDQEEGWEDRPLLIILIKLKRVFWWSWWPLFSSIRNRTPGFCGPVDR